MISDVIREINKKLLFLNKFPGQGKFGSQKHELTDCTVIVYEAEIKRATNNYLVERTAKDAISECMDCVCSQYSKSLEKVNEVKKSFRPGDFDKMLSVISSKSDIVVGENIAKAMQSSKRFKPMRRKQKGWIRKVGTLGESRVYSNSFIGRNDVYVIDRSIIDITWVVSEDNGKIRITAKTKTSDTGISKYVLIH